MDINLESLRKSKKTLQIASVLPAPFNPPIRTANNTGDLDDLGQAILEEGQLEAIHVVPFVERGATIYRAADGNRRRESMIKVGLTTIEAIVYEPGSHDPMQVLHKLFVKLNDKKRRFANRDMVEVGLADGPIFNGNVQSTVGYLHLLFPSGVPSLVKDNAGSYVLSVAKRAVKYCWSSLSKDSPTYRRHVANTLLWVIRNDQQQKVIAYMRLKYSPETLKHAIEKNKPTPRVTVAA